VPLVAGPRTHNLIDSLMRTTLSIAAALLLPATAYAQGPSSPPAPTCAAEFAWALDYIERNYSGFEYKVTAEARPRYDALVAGLTSESDRAADPEACDDILARWMTFFSDGHLSFGRPAAAAAAPQDDSPGAIRARYADAPRRDLSEAEARTRLDALGEARAPIEGIWEMQGGNYRGVVLRDDPAGRTFSMSILRADSVWWMPGQVKATFTPGAEGAYDVRFRMRDHSEQRWTGHVGANVLNFDTGSPWLREYPARPGDRTAAEVAEMQNSSFRVRDAGEGTLVLHVPTFNDTRRMDSLFAAEGGRIRAAERLVIDVRGNGGGSDHNFRELLPLVYTGPIRVVSNAMLATDDNIAAWEAQAADSSVPEPIRNALMSAARRMRQAEGRWLLNDDMMIDDLAVLPLPRRVDIIVDRGCASSCEGFLLAARQSAKVTIHGTRTAGIVDFGNVRSARMPGGTLRLNHPTTRTKRLPHDPVDGVGIQPHVAIPAGEADPVGWVLRHPGRPAPHD
jgi:hypothetical protein